MKILEVLKEEVELKTFDVLLKEVSEVVETPISIKFTHYVTHSEISNTISLAYHLHIDETTLMNSSTPGGNYTIDIVSIIRPHLEKLVEIFKGQTTQCEITIGGLLFSPTPTFRIDLYKFIPRHTTNSLQMYDASPEEILMGGLDFYSPTIEGFPVYDEETTKRIQKVERRVQTVTKVLSKGTYEGTPYTTELIRHTMNVDTKGVKTDGVIHVQDLVPLMWIKVTPPELGDVIRRKFGELMDIPEEDIENDIIVV